MPIKTYLASKDTTITNAYKPNLRVRAVSANMGEADSLEVFSIFGQVDDSSIEMSRVLVQFPVDEIAADRISGTIPSSGSVKHYLRMFNVKHPYSVPRDFTISVNPISRAWDEGYGLDMEDYSDNGWSLSGSGCDWMNSLSGTIWSSPGGAYLTGSQNTYDMQFDSGIEDLELDITDLVEKWITGSLDNNGVILKMSGSFEDGSQLRSFYTKKFSARGSEFFFKRPIIECRYEPTLQDDRAEFYASSSACEAVDNIMKLYCFNNVGGRKKNITSDQIPTVKFYADSAFQTEIEPVSMSVSNKLTGEYCAEVVLDTTASICYDRWLYPAISGSVIYSGQFDVYSRQLNESSDFTKYIHNIKNLKNTYYNKEKVQLKIFSREQDWNPNVYSVATATKETSYNILKNLYYKVFRLEDELTIIDYSTGSLKYSKADYDASWNRIYLDMSIFQPGYTYGIRLATYDGSTIEESAQTYKFKVI